MTTIMCPNEKLWKDDEVKQVDETLYQSLISCLMYLTTTRSDVLDVVSVI